MRNVTNIDVGMFEGKAGFTQTFDDGTREHYLFDLPVAEDLARKLLEVVKQYRYIEAQCGGIPTAPPAEFSDKIKMSDEATVQLSPPSTEEEPDADQNP